MQRGEGELEKVAVKKCIWSTRNKEEKMKTKIRIVWLCMYTCCVVSLCVCFYDERESKKGCAGKRTKKRERKDSLFVCCNGVVVSRIKSKKGLKSMR